MVLNLLNSNGEPVMKKRLIIVSFVLISLIAVACGKMNPSDTPSGLTEKPTPTPFATPAPAEYREKVITFSVENSFLSETDHLELTAEGATAIYYTLDGSTPSEESEKYDSPIMLRATSTVSAIPVSAIAQYEDGTWSDVVVRTYFAGLKITNR